MNTFGKTLFGDMEDENMDCVAITPKLKRSHSKISFGAKLPMPSITEDTFSQLNDSFMSEADSIEQSPIASPAKMLYSPERATSYQSPPSIRRGFLALKLFDTPHTPRTLLSKLKSATTPDKSTDSCEKETRVNLNNRFGSKNNSPRKSIVNKNIVYANVNPFTPSPDIIRTKRSRQECEDESILSDSMGSDEDETEIMGNPAKKLPLREANVSRYDAEFVELGKLGAGSFGTVYKCLNRLDGCIYALKKSLKPLAGSVSEKMALKEVWAHAVLENHQHVVRYFSAWAENHHMLIQNEFCDGGNLSELICKNRIANIYFKLLDLKQLLLQLSKGLKYIHSRNLVHMDIKPGNIFMCVSSPLSQRQNNTPTDSSSDDGYCGEESHEHSQRFNFVYKIGDLGHVTSINNPEVEEGDCRFLPKEVLQEDYRDLTKADIFALGLTGYLAAGGDDLPKNGPDWHKIRLEGLPYLSNQNKDFNNLLTKMTDQNPEMRPSSIDLPQEPFLGMLTKNQLRKELQEERFKNEMLSRKLVAAEKAAANQGTNIFDARNKRLVGTKVSRSMSMSVIM